MKNSHSDPLTPQVVLGVAAHPDDLDFGASGTLAHFAQKGAKVYYLILTDGGKGTSDPNVSPETLIEARESEQRAAVAAIGGAGVDFLRYPDACLEVSMDLKKHIVAAIRKYKPDVVVTIDPSMLYAAELGFINHPDHRAAGQAALDAVFPLARDHLSFPELESESLTTHCTPTVLLINFNEHNYVVDISDTFTNKIDAIKAHNSQVSDSAEILRWISEMSGTVGQDQGFKYAEAFVRIDIKNT